MNAPYFYQGNILEIIDGDTLKVELDLGFHTHSIQTVRLAKVDAPEMHSKNELERRAAIVSRNYIVQNTAGKNPIFFKSYKNSDKYGRYLADVYIGNSILNNDMLLQGLVKAYNGAKKPEWTESELQYIISKEYK